MSPFEEKIVTRAFDDSRATTAAADRPDRLRIALVTETYPPELNGVSLTVKRAVDYLRCRGHTVEVVRPRQTADRKGAQDNDDVLMPGMPLPMYPGVQFGFPATRRLRRHWSRQRPQVVHVATEGPLGWSALHAAQSLGIPVTSDYRTHFSRYSRYYGMAWLARPIDAYLRGFHNRAHMTFVSTSALQRDLAARGYRNVARIGRGVDTRLFNPSRRSESLRARWGLGPRDLCVIHVGRLAREKNLDVAVRAYDGVRATRGDARMVWVGDGPARRRLQRAHPDHIFAGLQDGVELAAHYASGDLFVFPSLTETFGNVTLEALASGLAVVAFDEGAAAQHAMNGINARLVRVGDETGFIAAVVEIASHPFLLSGLRAEAPRATSALSWPTVLGGFERHLLASAHGYRLYDNELAAA
jgi:glycosyltransferase involved in cell wall biosynthesis